MQGLSLGHAAIIFLGVPYTYLNQCDICLVYIGIYFYDLNLNLTKYLNRPFWSTMYRYMVLSSIFKIQNVKRGREAFVLFILRSTNDFPVNFVTKSISQCVPVKRNRIEIHHQYNPLKILLPFFFFSLPRSTIEPS